ncbi:MAG: SMC-Scp complex subunit ScpB [Phycisphaerales bacterium]
MNDDQELMLRVEAVLMTADRPLGERKVASILDLLGADSVSDEAEVSTEDNSATGGKTPGRGPVVEIRSAVAALNEAYEEAGRSFRIEHVAGGLQVLTLPEFAGDIARLKGVRQQSKLSQAALETLAIIAYRQPILRADLESIRGVACGEVLRGLMDRRLARIAGRAEEVGRPMLYGTTREFLEVFGLANLDDLPQAKELRPTPVVKPKPAKIAETESGDEDDHATPTEDADTMVNEANEVAEVNEVMETTPANEPNETNEIDG